MQTRAMSALSLTDLIRGLLHKCSFGASAFMTGGASLTRCIASSFLEIQEQDQDLIGVRVRPAAQPALLSRFDVASLRTRFISWKTGDDKSSNTLNIPSFTDAARPWISSVHLSLSRVSPRLSLETYKDDVSYLRATLLRPSLRRFSPTACIEEVTYFCASLSPLYVNDLFRQEELFVSTVQLTNVMYEYGLPGGRESQSTIGTEEEVVEKVGGREEEEEGREEEGEDEEEAEQEKKGGNTEEPEPDQDKHETKTKQIQRESIDDGEVLEETLHADLHEAETRTTELKYENGVDGQHSNKAESNWRGKSDRPSWVTYSTGGKFKLRSIDLEESFVRGSGPGGQKINKTKNCVVLKHLPTKIVVHCQETRTLEANRGIAKMRLTELVERSVFGSESKAARREAEKRRKKLKKKAKTKKRLQSKHESKLKNKLVHQNQPGDQDLPLD